MTNTGFIKRGATCSCRVVTESRSWLWGHCPDSVSNLRASGMPSHAVQPTSLTITYRWSINQTHCRYHSANSRELPCFGSCCLPWLIYEGARLHRLSPKRLSRVAEVLLACERLCNTINYVLSCVRPLALWLIVLKSGPCAKQNFCAPISESEPPALGRSCESVSSMHFIATCFSTLMLVNLSKSCPHV